MIKSCLDFVYSIGYDNFKNSITTYFDHMMAFYKLCGFCEFESISSITNDDVAEFHIYFANRQDTYTLQYILESSTDKRINIYGKWFMYESEQKSETGLIVKIYPSPY